MMRTAGKRLIDFYRSQLGQDVIETGLGAASSVAYQTLATDMTPEEIALSTALGIGGAAIGRPIIGGLSQRAGTRLAKTFPGLEQEFKEMFDEGMKRKDFISEGLKAKLEPYKDLPALAQVGQIVGRQYGDNVVQGLIALGSPLLTSGDD